jgi:sugar diacid utilization regulator/putative methionine-R-sulfoxide reductase with GAF domain
LQEIVSTVASSLELDAVLRAVVRLLSDASAVHACFVYLVDDDRDRLVLRAASPPYDHLIDQVVLERGKGLAWWAAERNEPAFIPDNLLDDPRVEYVPELEEERFQSLLSVPIAARDGTVIGVISAHTEAPREFTRDEVEFVVTSASLVAGAIENARLYEEMRTRVGELEALTALAELIAEAQTIDELLPAVASRARELLGARAAHVYLLEDGSEELALRSSAPADANARARIGLAELGPELARGGRAARIAVPLVASDELLGLVVAEGGGAVDLARAVASQTAVGIKKIQLIERLTEKNLIKDFFEELAGGRTLGNLEGRAARLGCDLSQPHLVLLAEPANDELERALAAVVRGAVFDRSESALRALLPVRAGAEKVAAAVRDVHTQLKSQAAVGLSNACQGEASFAEGFEEARRALVGTAVLRRDPGVTSFEELGAYKYLLGIALESGNRDATADAVAQIADYDGKRGASLLATLEEFLGRRGSISATSDALYIHPNTLRQRLRRIAELSGLDLRRDDWLAIEIAVKLVRLREALGSAESDTSRP